MRHDDLTADFDRLCAELVHRTRHARFEPNADVYADEDAGRIVVQVELAGADADQLRVGVEERSLIILGTRENRAGASGALHQKEIQYGEFIKRIHLPWPVDEKTATAVYRDGILTITLPVAGHKFFPTRRTEIRMTVKRIPV
jgi:HSP20 family protein